MTTTTDTIRQQITARANYLGDQALDAVAIARATGAAETTVRALQANATEVTALAARAVRDFAAYEDEAEATSLLDQAAEIL